MPNPATPTKQKPTAVPAPVVDPNVVAAVLDAATARQKRAELEKLGLLTGPRYLVPTGGIPREYAGRARTPHSENAPLPGAPMVWPGERQIIEQGVGDKPLATHNTFNGTTSEWLREATPEELADPELASDQTAAAFLRAQLPVIGAEKFAAAVDAGNGATKKRIENLRKQLAEAEADLQTGEALAATAASNVEKEREKLAAFVEGTGKTQEALDRAAELLQRPAPAIPFEPPSIKVPPPNPAARRAV